MKKNVHPLIQVEIVTLYFRWNFIGLNNYFEVIF